MPRFFFLGLMCDFICLRNGRVWPIRLSVLKFSSRDPSRGPTGVKASPNLTDPLFRNGEMGIHDIIKAFCSFITSRSAMYHLSLCTDLVRYITASKFVAMASSVDKHLVQKSSLKYN